MNDQIFHDDDGINYAARQLHQIFIQSRREIERQEKEAQTYLELKTGIIYHPQPKDVLVGRGRPYQEYPGNIRYGTVIDSYLDEYYKQTDRFAKTCISMQIVKQVKGYGGRFLDRDISSGTWRVIEDLAAREKTAIGFRSRVSKVGETPPDSSTILLSSSTGRHGGGDGSTTSAMDATGAGNGSSRKTPSSSPRKLSGGDTRSSSSHDNISASSNTTNEAKRLRYDPSVLP